MTFAPRPFRMSSFYYENLDGRVMIVLYPLTTAAMHMPTPVFPLVGSTRTSPGLILPYFSASKIKRRPILSLTEPPGLRNSHFTTISQSMFSAFVILLILTIGVSPTQSRILSFIFLLLSLISEIWGHGKFLGLFLSQWHALFMP